MKSKLPYLMLCIGFAARLGVWAVNPPGNSYDDHLRPIWLYATELQRPSLDACWQCYQPPLYYVIGAGVLRLAGAIGLETWTAWKCVQLLSAAASCTTLAVAWLILRRLPGPGGLVALSVLALWPRSLYTAGMISNDAWLILSATVAIWGFLRCYEDRQLALNRRAVAGVAIGSLAAAMTKQSGLVLACLPVWLLWDAWSQRRSETPQAPMRPAAIAVLALVVALMPADELWRASQSGRFFTSNQHLLGPPQGQPPGNLAGISFHDLRLRALLVEPRMGPSTIDSFWTQLYGRFWVDYEPRYLPATTANTWLFRSLLVLGLVPATMGLIGIVRVMGWARDRSPYEALIWVTTGFLCAPLIQTLRFPYFSSIKAVFVMPAIAAIGLWVGLGTDAAWKRPWLRGPITVLTVLLVVACLAHAVALIATGWAGVPELSGPIWPLPDLE